MLGCLPLHYCNKSNSTNEEIKCFSEICRNGIKIEKKEKLLPTRTKLITNEAKLQIEEDEEEKISSSAIEIFLS